MEAFQRKISPQAVADHRDVQVYCDHEQLFGLLRGEELALVAQHAGQRAFGACIADRRKDIHLGRDQQVGLAAHTQTAHQFVAALGVNLRLQDQNLHALLFVVVGYLHQGGALAAVHGAVAEIQFCHKRLSS